MPSLHSKKLEMKKLLYLLFLVTLLSGCTSSKTTVSSNVDLSKYRYATVINNDTYHIPAELMEYEILLYDAVEASRLSLVGDWRVYELTPEQQSELLLVKYGVGRDDFGTVVTVNFIDYVTGRPVASCRGAYSLGIDHAADLRGAIDRVAGQISQTSGSVLMNIDDTMGVV